MTKPLIFCAIDTADLGHAINLAKHIGPVTGALKLGLEFFSCYGPQGIEEVQKSAPDAALFIDLKYHDIPNTVAGAVKWISDRFRPAFLNVHASGGLPMMKAAKEACHPDTQLLGVTLLTSLGPGDAKDIGYGEDTESSVERLALLAKRAGLDGVVCSPLEVHKLRQTCGPDFVLMTPGIRPGDAAMNDQRRAMAPRQALQLGATHLVVGRPITQADDPAKAAQSLVEEIGT